MYSGLNLNQDKATKPQTVQIVRQGEATPYWFKFNPLQIYESYNVTNTLSLWLTVSAIDRQVGKTFFCEEDLVIIEDVWKMY